MDTPHTSMAAPAITPASAVSRLSIYHQSSSPSQIIISMGSQQARRLTTAMTTPTILSTRAVEVFAAGDRVTCRAAVWARFFRLTGVTGPVPLFFTGVGMLPAGSCCSRGGGIRRFCPSLPKSLNSSTARAMGQSPTRNSTAIRTQEAASLLGLFFLDAIPQSSFFFSFFRLPFSSTTYV